MDDPQFQPRASNGRFMRVVHSPGGPGRERAAGRPLPRPRDLLAAVQRAGAAARRRRDRCRCWSGPASWRSSRRNLDEFFMVRVAGLKRRIATGIAVRSRLRARAARGARADLPGRARAAWPCTPRSSSERGAAGPGRRGHRDRPLGRADRGRARRAAPACSPTGVPGADPAGRRPGAPLPLHLRPLAQPRGRAGQPQDRQGALRPGQGAAAAAPAAAHRARGRRVRRWPTCTTPGSCRSRTSSRRTWTSSSRAWRSASTSRSGSPATRTSRSRRTTPRTSSPPWRRS